MHKCSDDRSLYVPEWTFPDIMNDIFRLKENMYNFQNFHIFQTENSRSLKCGLDAIPYSDSQLWHQVSIDICDAASLAPFKIEGNVKVVM